MRLILASASPRRAELLTAAGFTFETVIVDIDESVRPGEAPETYVRRLAMEKSERGANIIAGPPEEGHNLGPPKGGHHVRSPEGGHPVAGPPEGGHHVRRDESSYVASGFSRTISDRDVIVLGADTAVVVDGEILGKPRDDVDAERMLRRLSGRRHQVMTGVSLRGYAVEVGSVVTTMVDVMPLSPADVAWYVASGEGRDKAGGYAVQGRASRFIAGIEGSYANVVGLPVAQVSSLLRDLASPGRSRYSD